MRYIYWVCDLIVGVFVLFLYAVAGIVAKVLGEDFDDYSL
jgi:hypothetical protein